LENLVVAELLDFGNRSGYNGSGSTYWPDARNEAVDYRLVPLHSAIAAANRSAGYEPFGKKSFYTGHNQPLTGALLHQLTEHFDRRRLSQLTDASQFAASSHLSATCRALRKFLLFRGAHYYSARRHRETSPSNTAIRGFRVRQLI
jgi:hypothetical protein